LIPSRFVMSERQKTVILLIGLTVAIGTRVLLAEMTPFSSDFFTWAGLGQSLLGGLPVSFFGVYAGPAYISGAALSVWISLTHNPYIRSQFENLYLNGSTNPGSSITPEMYAFTLVMKLPMLITDLLTIITIIVIVRSVSGSTSRGLLAGILWTSSPLIFLLETTSLLEIYPALLILLAAFAIRRASPIVGSIIGSAFMAVGVIIRFAPLLLIWIYVIAFARLRQIKTLAGFLAVQVTVALLALFYFVQTSGWDSIPAVLNSRWPGVVIPEVLSTVGPFITARGGYNSYDIGLSFAAYLLLAYFVTKPSTWQSRPVGSEVLAFFAPYFALTSFHAPFLLWMIPTFLVYAMTTGFGARRFILSTSLGFLYYLFEASKHLMGAYKPNAVFYIPNMNNTMVSLSATLYQLYLTQPLPQVFRSLFSASLILVIFWLLKEAKSNVHISSTGWRGLVSGRSILKRMNRQFSLTPPCRVAFSDTRTSATSAELAQSHLSILNHSEPARVVR
jgi:hypothetical protein